MERDRPGLVHYTKRLGEGARKRLHVQRNRGRIDDYMVQLEVDVQAGDWREVLRYDPADRGPHCDIYHIDGRDRDEELNFPYDINTGWKAALQHADDDVEAHWANYQSRFLEGKWPK